MTMASEREIEAAISAVGEFIETHPNVAGCDADALPRGIWEAALSAAARVRDEEARETTASEREIEAALDGWFGEQDWRSDFDAVEKTVIASDMGNALSAAARVRAEEGRPDWPETGYRFGDLVRKTKGPEWQGPVCGWYRTGYNPSGFCVESSGHRWSVQIYPASMLEVCGVCKGGVSE